MKKSVVIFYILLLYALAELFWWGTMVVRIQPAKMAMVAGEGSVFVFLLGVGAYFIHSAIAKEDRVKQQQQNFLLSVTHELKSPLAAIKLSLQTIVKRELEREKLTSLLNNSLKDIERLDDVVENMLLATKMENKSYSFPKEEIDFSELVVRVVDRIRNNICVAGQKIETDVEADVKLLADKFAITSVVTNLVENALKYSGDGARVYVALKRVGDGVQLGVADNGSGITDKDKMLVFDKFYRTGNEHTRRTKGTGLGLFIVKEVADRHDADIVVKDNSPKGTIFEVNFAC